MCKSLRILFVRKMFATIFILGVIAAHVTAELPSYIHTCGRRNPNLDKCIMDSIIDLRENICNGIPELKSPPLESLMINHLDIFNAHDAKLYLKDSQILKFCDYDLDSFHINLDTLYFDFNILYKQVHVNGTYGIDIRLLVPIALEGPVYIIGEDIIIKANVTMKMINKNNKKYIYLSEINLKIEIKKISSKFEAVEGKTAQLNEILNIFLANNEKMLLNNITPSLEKELSKQLILIANNIVKHFTFDELFPDRT